MCEFVCVFVFVILSVLRFRLLCCFHCKCILVIVQPENKCSTEKNANADHYATAMAMAIPIPMPSVKKLCIIEIYAQYPISTEFRSCYDQRNPQKELYK